MLSIDPLGQMPWERWPLSDWHIVGMNHYFQKGKDDFTSSSRQLYVALRERNGNLAISAEGPADGQFANRLWFDLSVKAVLAKLPREFVLSFDPTKVAKTDEDIATIFADEPGGLIWCALRQNRLASQHFNPQVAKMLKTCREKFPSPSRTPYWDTTIKDYLPHDILGNDERRDVWAAALHQIAYEQQGLWTWRIEGRQ